MAVSLSGLEMPWLKKDRSVQTGRFLFDEKKGRVVTAEQWAKSNVRKVKRSDIACPMFMADIQEFVNVANPERTHRISSRSELRSFERSFGCYQVGNDIPPGTIAAKNEAKKAAREELAKGIESGWNDL